MVEIWKPIEGYEGYYEVSNLGNVKSLDRIISKANGVNQPLKSIMMTKTPNRDGYLTVKLSMNGIENRVAIHILVGKAFVEGYSDGLEIDHLDTIRTNNIYTNLEWVTHEENNRRTFERGHHISQTRGLMGENNPNYGNHKLHEKYLNNPELSKKNQGRPGSQNGRAISVSVVINEELMTFETLRECAEYLINNNIVRSKTVDNVASRISLTAKSNKQYNGLNFIIE